MGNRYTAKSCAYCDGASPLTRDHVWPSAVLDEMGRVDAHFSHQSGRVHGGDLDGYLCQLYDAYFSVN